MGSEEARKREAKRSSVRQALDTSAVLGCRPGDGALRWKDVAWTDEEEWRGEGDEATDDEG